MNENKAPAKHEIKGSAINQIPIDDEIAVRAYEIFLERGGTPGRDLEDWLQAELELAKQ